MSTKEPKQHLSVGQIVERRVELFEKHTKLEASYKIHELCYSDIHLGVPLGKGTYSNVYSASLRDNPTKMYALKRLSPDVSRDKKDFKTGSVDLALESKLLEKLNHPNLIKVHGVKSGDICESVEEGNFFVLLDLLTATLEDRIETWQTSYNRNLFRRNKSLVSRVENAALGIARGMQYLHQQGIIFRDLKPQNVGFSPDGQVKIFDLGIARDVQQCLATNQKLGFAGTPRYMAPEVGNGEIYDLSADIYSFGILLWEICTLQKPFSKMRTLGDYQKIVVEQGIRPQVNKIRHAGLRDLITACWSDYPHLRPSFPMIVGILEEICGHVKAPATSVKLFKMDSKQRTTVLLSDALTEVESMVEGLNIRVP